MTFPKARRNPTIQEVEFLPKNSPPDTDQILSPRRAKKETPIGPTKPLAQISTQSVRHTASILMHIFISTLCFLLGPSMRHRKNHALHKAVSFKPPRFKVPP
jgi:hypothetical protein